VVLGKQNYNWTQLRSAAGSYTLNTKYTIKVEVSGANIKVYVDDMNAPKIDYTDPDPFISGKVGLRAYNAYVLFDNFSVTTSYQGDPSGLNDYEEKNQIFLYPNPVTDKLTLTNIHNFTDLTIYNVDGQKVYNTRLADSEMTFDMRRFNSGIYLLQLSNKDGNIAVRRFMKN
jgi:hypothetical protein